MICFSMRSDQVLPGFLDTFPMYFAANSLIPTGFVRESIFETDTRFFRKTWSLVCATTLTVMNWVVPRIQSPPPLK
jgi:hypothetical protein